MNRHTAVDVLDRLHEAQNAFYAGRSGAELEKLLTEDVSWSVPGDNAIAGTYRGRDEVFGYFQRRRELANRTLRLERQDVLVGDGNRVAALTDGVARGQRWSTVGLYEIVDERIAACWLLPIDQRAFDAIWSP